MSRLLHRFVPPQHGAWAMLVVPFVAAVTLVGWRWVDGVLFVGWLSGYLLSYYAFQAVKTRRPRRSRHQLAVYSGLAVPAVAVVAWRVPAVLLYAPAYAALLGINASYAWRRRDRALVNDIASVVQSCLVVFVVAAVAGRPPVAVLGVFTACLAYFIGTALFVKTMIRERANAAYRRWSIGYHVATLALVGWLGWALAVVFGWLLVRAAVLPARRLTPKVVGLVELLNCLLLLAALALVAR